MRQAATAGVALFLTILSLAQPVLAQEPKWGPHIDLEAKPGTKRSLGEADLFIPVAQSADTLLFANLRLRMDDNDSNEGNYGLGVRHMLESGWNLGAYGYFDRRRTEYDNHFNQVTLGVEALSQDWDLRANYYAPVGRRSHLVDSLSTAEISGTTVLFRGGEERSMGGFDAEVGWRVPLFDASADRQFRIFGGAYHFSESGVEDITGPRARAELTFDSVPYLWEGSRFSLGAEWQHDDPRGSQGFLTARLRIPLQVYGRPASTLTPMERRMADPIVRDIDVVSQAGQFSAPEAVTRTAGGSTITVLSSATTTGAALPGAVAGAAANSIVILSGTFDTTAATIVGGKTLMGAGAVHVVSPSGRTAVLNTPSAAINGTNINVATLQLEAGGTLTGMNITANFTATGGAAVRVSDLATNATITNNVITVNQSGNNAGIAFSIGTTTTGMLSGNTLIAAGSGAATTMNAMVLNDSNPNFSTFTVTNNTLSASGGTTNNIAIVGRMTITDGSGNVRGSGACVNNGNNTGTISFTNGTSCP